MTEHLPQLTSSERHLLHAIARVPPDDSGTSCLTVRLVGYAFQLNLPGFPASIRDVEEKAYFERDLKSLVSRQLVFESEALHDHGWKYSLTAKGEEALKLSH